MKMTKKRYKQIIKELQEKEHKTDEEIFYLACDFIRTVESNNVLPRGEAWARLVEYLDNEGFEITK